VAVLRGRVPIR
jgi:serine-type D-Ala-D-Ala carboxypeptidase (penicillin-binding protein 5/6)